MATIFRLFSSLVLSLLVVIPAKAAPKSELWEFWQPVAQTNKESIDHRDWQRLLQEYVHTDATGINLFDYKSVSHLNSALLDSYLIEMQTLDPRTYSPAEQKAYWINLYNALTVKLILDNYPVESITKLGKGFFKFGPWDDPVAEIAGKTLTLNDIEHRILRPIWQDPRIHFAVNCASIGCPNLQATTFTAANTEALLDEAALDYLSHDRGVSFDASGKLQLSSIFDWYAEDFGNNQNEVLTKLSEYTPVELAGKLATYEGKIRYDYDWRLNEFIDGAQ